MKSSPAFVVAAGVTLLIFTSCSDPADKAYKAKTGDPTSAKATSPSTGVDYVIDAIKDLREYHHVLVLSDVDPTQREAMERTGIVDLVGLDNIVWREPVIGRAADVAYERAVAALSAPPAD